MCSVRIMTDDRMRYRAECDAHEWRSPWITAGPAWIDGRPRPSKEQRDKAIRAADAHLRGRNVNLDR